MDADLARLPVAAEMLRSHARVERAQALDDGAWFVHWHNADTQAHYRRPGHHTLSFYLAGGHEVRCLDEPGARGRPGVMCCLPAEHESHWDVGGSLQLLHLYLPRLSFAQAAERWFDLDPRCAALPERIYFDDPVLSDRFRRVACLDWDDADARLALQMHALDLQQRLLQSHVTHRRALQPPRGGLSPAARRRVVEHVEQSLHEGPSLASMAGAACLSEFHFARMFRRSFGVSPHAWVMQRRLQRARALLAQPRWTLEEVARRCGYAHASHLNSALARAGLGTAQRYRRALQL